MGWRAICSGEAYSGVIGAAAISVAGAGQRRVFVQQLGHAEVQQAHLAFGRHQDVARLQVAVHHQPRMRKLDRLQHLQEQLHPLAQAGTPAVAVLGDGLAVHVLHGQPGLGLAARAVFGAGVIEPGDQRVLQRGEDVALALEAQRQRGWRAMQPGQLQGHGPLQFAVHPFGQPDAAHAALAQQAQQVVRAQALAAGGCSGIGGLRAGHRLHQARQAGQCGVECGGGGIVLRVGQPGQQLGPPHLLRWRQLVQPGLARGVVRQRQPVVQQGRQLLQLAGVQGHER